MMRTRPTPILPTRRTSSLYGDQSATGSNSNNNVNPQQPGTSYTTEYMVRANDEKIDQMEEKVGKVRQVSFG